MKTKLMTLLLTPAILLSLASCGGGEAASKPDEDRSSVVASFHDDEKSGSNAFFDMLPEQTTFPLAGTWKMIQKTEKEPTEIYVIDEDGNMKWGGSYTLENDPDDIVWDDDVTLSYYRKTNSGRSGLSMHFTRNYKYQDAPAEYYSIVTGDIAVVNNRYFYREEDFADYDVIELTPENVAEYIECFTEFCPPAEDADGAIDSIEVRYGIVRFKEGLGAPSFVIGELTCTRLKKAITIDPMSGKVTVGETLETEDGATVSAQCCAVGDYTAKPGTLDTYFLHNDGGTEPVVGEAQWFYEVTGAETIIGRVYVPKGWNP